MSEGFFVFLVKTRASTRAAKAKASLWRARLLDPVDGWEDTAADTPQAAISLQKQQYDLKAGGAKPRLPLLVLQKEMPKASGQMVRFVSVVNA